MVTGDARREQLAAGYRAFSDETSAEAPVYSVLAAAVARDRDVLDFLLGLPEEK